jgi:small subunit ribosomal protein S1
MDAIQAAAGEGTPEEMQADMLADDRPVPVPPAGPAAIMAELPVADWDYQQPRRGQIRPGVILSIGEQEIIVGLDAKRDGVVPYADMQRMGAEALSQLQAGDRVDVFILQPEDQDGNLVVSLYQAWQVRAWEQAKVLADSGEIWEAPVVGYNKGGLVVPVGELRGFIPASQVPGFPQGLDQEERIRRLAAAVGGTLRVKVIEIDRRNRRLILSALAADREWRQAQREQLMGQLREGEVRRGVVSSLSSFGAFVDLGGAEGLIHLSELSWQRVRHPREVLRVGDEVEVYVMRLDDESKRIGLSLKRLQPEPWALVEDRYELGQLVEGTITNVVDFGAFAQIGEGVEGLVHVSELTDQPITHPRDIVRRGDLVLLRIIRIDLRRKRLGLSLKRVLESEWAEWSARLAEAEGDGRGRAAARRVRRSKPVPRPPEPTPEPAAAEAEPDDGVFADGIEETAPVAEGEVAAALQAEPGPEPEPVAEAEAADLEPEAVPEPVPVAEAEAANPEAEAVPEPVPVAEAEGDAPTQAEPAPEPAPGAEA